MTEFYILKWIETHVEYPYAPLLQYVAKIHIFRPHDVPRVRDLPPGRSADRPERLRGYLYIERITTHGGRQNSPGTDFN